MKLDKSNFTLVAVKYQEISMNKHHRQNIIQDNFKINAH